MHRFTLEELERCDGKEGRPAYIAYEGKVYDVTESFLWKQGRHQIRHRAGRVYHAGLADAPHGPELIWERFPLVGELVSNIDASEG